MKIIFDLDHTLLDTDRLKLDLVSIFPKQDFAADYQKYYKDKGENFDFENYLDLLESKSRINHSEKEKLRVKLAALLDQIDNYLYPDVENIFKSFQASGAKLILMTFGNKEWQANKVRNLSINRYFTEIIFEDKGKSKSDYLKSLNNSQEDILIVNDNAKETGDMVKVIGNRAIVFLVDGPNAKNINHDWPIHKLAELTSYKLL